VITSALRKPSQSGGSPITHCTKSSSASYAWHANAVTDSPLCTTNRVGAGGCSRCARFNDGADDVVYTAHADTSDTMHLPGPGMRMGKFGIVFRVVFRAAIA
jgi:hypothetical protein